MKNKWHMQKWISSKVTSYINLVQHVHNYFIYIEMGTVHNKHQSQVGVMQYGQAVAQVLIFDLQSTHCFTRGEKCNGLYMHSALWVTYSVSAYLVTHENTEFTKAILCFRMLHSFQTVA